MPGYLFVLPWYPVSPIGGVNQVVLKLIDLMSQAGQYQPYLLVPYGPLDPPQALHLNCPVLSLPIRSPLVKGHPFRSPVAFLLTLPWTLWKLRSLIQERDIQIINCHFPAPDCFIYVVLKRLALFSGKVVLSVHGSDLKAALARTGIARGLVQLLFRSADYVIACSNGLREDLLRLEPRCNRNSLVVHNAIDIDAFETLVAPGYRLPDPPGNRRFLLNVGRFEHQKGQDILIHAFEEIAETFPDLFLVMIGMPGTETDEIKRMVVDSPVAARIVMIENLPHECVPAFLKAALLFVLPSRREGLPLVILEAAACRKPVIAAAAVGVPELIQDRITGRLVPIDDERSLAEAISDLVSNRDLRETVAEGLHQLVREHFTWAQAYEKYMNLGRP